MSTWIRDHLDPCLRELLTPLGPFADCSHSERFRSLTPHTPLPTLPTLTPQQTGDPTAPHRCPSPTERDRRPWGRSPAPERPPPHSWPRRSR